MLDQLTPQQRKLAAIGVPVVAVFALISVIQKRNQPAAAPPTTGFMPGGHAPSTDVIGVGQLAEFESLLSGQISQLARQIGDMKANPNPAPPAPAPAAKKLPTIDSRWFPTLAPQGEDFNVLGTVTGEGFKGYNVGGGVPVYAFEDGRWFQGFDMKKLKAGTILGVPDTFQQYIDYENPVR